MTSKLQLLESTGLLCSGAAGADVAWSMESVASAAGQVAAQLDLGASPRNWEFSWHCGLYLQATPTQYTTVQFYAASAPNGYSTLITGDVGSSDAALGDVDQLRNLQYIGSVTVEEADTTLMVGAGFFRFRHRYLSLVGFNNTGATINATDTNFQFVLTGSVIQGQAT